MRHIRLAGHARTGPGPAGSFSPGTVDSVEPAGRGCPGGSVVPGCV